jgi:putative ABC transport system permease protein
MFIHYLKIAFRNMRKYGTQSLTGIFGLAFGLACFVPALYWLRYETSYDSFYPGAENIYCIYTMDKQSGKANDFVSGILEKKLHEQFAAMQTSTVFFIEQNDCSAEGTSHIRLNMLFTDSTFFSVFPQVVVSGNVRQPLQITNNIVLTESVAVRLFGDVEKAIGQPIKSSYLNDDPPYTVTAVVKDPPVNTNLPFDAILFHEQIKLQKSFVEQSGNEIWTFSFLQMFARINPHTDTDYLAKQLRDFPLQSYANANIEVRMLPVSDVRHRLNTDLPFTLNFIRLFVAAGILLLFSAGFNFLNLHLNLFHQRIREFHLRTVHGATGGQLVRQMLFELACAILLALLPACCLVVIARPAFSGLLNIEMGMLLLIQLFAVCGTCMMALMLFTGFITFRWLSRLAIRPRSERKTAGQPVLRRMAVTLQLAVSVVFIVATLVVMKQMSFINDKDLGFDSNGIIHLSGLRPFIDDNVRVALKDELASIPQIEHITDTDFTPQHNVNPFKMITSVEWKGKYPDEKTAFNFITTDSRFAETFGVTLLEGEWLDGAGEHKIVLNEEAVRVMGLNEPVGTVIRVTLNKMQEYRVVGVVKDFHTLSLRSRIHPIIFVAYTHPANNLYVRVMPGREQETIKQINAILPEIDATFADVHPVPLTELYDRLNYSEQMGMKMFSVLATVCLLISLFSIYAVATASTRRRRKEIAIRKIVGAEVGEIVHMFFREYTLLVIIAGVVALPPVYLAMSRWLQGYAYRTDIPWWLLTGVIAGVVAVVLLTALGQVLRAANSNPAEVVKNE